MITKKRFGLVGVALTITLLAGCAQPGPSQPASATRSPAPESAAAQIEEPPLVELSALKPGYPQQYTVQPGDNLWDISSRYLNDPWRWGALWPAQSGAGQSNAVAGPALYPGSVIELTAQSGTAQLRLANGQRPTIKLSPQVRVSSILQPIPTIDADVIAPFLENSIVLTGEQWRSAPYIIGNEDNSLLPTTGSKVYARGGLLDYARYRIFRPGQELRDPGAGNSLGYSMIYIGEAAVEDDGDPALLQLVSAERGARPGDRLWPLDSDPAVLDFVPEPVPIDTQGRIIGALDNSLVIGRYSNVVVNVGLYEGMRPGHVMAVYKTGAALKDPIAGETVPLPRKRVGTVILYRVFDLVSYGLVMEAESDLRVNDLVAEP